MILHVIKPEKTVTRVIATRHEYWLEEVYYLPECDRDRKPIYVCIEY